MAKKTVNNKQFSISGRVIDKASREGLQGLRVEAWDLGEKGADPIAQGTTDADGSFELSFTAAELKKKLIDAQPDIFFKVFRDKQLIKSTEDVILWDHNHEETEVVIQIKEAGEGDRVEGHVSSRISASVGGLRVEIVSKGTGGDVRLAEAITDDEGNYQTTYSDGGGGKSHPDLQARVFVGKTFLGASEVRYDASIYETLNVLLDDKATPALRSEFETLTSALAPHLSGRLGNVKEDDDRQDITYLANKTGWDARAVALAALADQFASRTADAAGTPAVPQAYFYALFRSGLPANEDALYHTDAKTLETVWKQAAEMGVIPKDSVDQIPKLVSRFQTLSAEKLLTGPPVAGTSSFKEMLTASGLNDKQQAQFAQLYATHRGDMEGFWKAVGSSFGEKTASRLQLDGKLAFLTINNAPLMQKLRQVAGSNLSDTLQLAQTGYYRPEAWAQLITDGVAIPKEIPGDTPETKASNYARFLAAQVRLSYPSLALAEMVKAGDLPLPGAPEGASDRVHAFLSEHQEEFEIGVEPVERYIARNKLQVADDTVHQVKRLQRVYQITPSDQAMSGLLKRGIDAAYHVVPYDRDTFVASFAEDLGGADQAGLTYDRSVQIHNAVLNIALSYVSARTSPAIGVHSPAGTLDPAPGNVGDVIAGPTLEKLFGSMDFCACEHCGSILSPAAYLVDLLLFLKSDSRVWADYLSKWRREHGGAPYPFANPDAWSRFQSDWNTRHPGQPLPSTEVSPFDVLTSRRPDIENLPLTCENTNTALPYIDLVNETLEYFVGHNAGELSLDGFLGHDTGGANSEDLMASPQSFSDDEAVRVRDAAYRVLREGASFPTPLPFHQPLEYLRRCFNRFEVPLPLAMERLRKNDVLDGDPTASSDYGWRDIWMEEIGLSRAEHKILTHGERVDASDTDFVPLWEMYGLPDGTEDANVVAELSNAKGFARRVGITYEELVSVLRTRFINPDSDLIPKLERLGVSFAALKALHDGDMEDSDFQNRLPADALAPDPAEYGGDLIAWVRDDTNYDRIMGLITLAIPAWRASTAYTAGNCVVAGAPAMESTLYYECTTAGTSGTTEPTWPTTPGDTKSDGSSVWTCRHTVSCSSFDSLALRYSNPDAVARDISAVDFVRLLRFIRLWRKLGWTIEQTDAATCALYRGDMAPLTRDDVATLADLDASFLRLFPRLAILVRVMKALNLTVKRDLLALLACWSDIGTGSAALYRQMFLNPALLKQDPVFADNGYGEFLTDTLVRLGDHVEALRSAFNLAGDEYALIVADLHYDDDPHTRLTIPNISAIFRRGWLARKLRLSVRELLLLMKMTGLDPFASPDPKNPSILSLITLVQAMRDRSLKSATALYVIWNQDLSGRSRPDAATVASLARTLRLGLAAVEAEFAISDDPNGTIAQTQVAKVYGADTAAFFFGLLNGSLSAEVPFNDPDGTFATDATRHAIEDAAGNTEAGSPRIAFDDFRKRLSYTGVLTEPRRDDLKAAAGVGAGDFRAAVDDLFEASESTVRPFFDRYPELKSDYETYVADTAHPVAEKRRNLLQSILPNLIQRRKRQQVLQSVSASANTDLALAQAILDTPTAPFPLHAIGQDDQPALKDLLGPDAPGLSVEFFAGDSAAGPVIPAPDIASNLDYAPAHDAAGNPLPVNPSGGGAAISGVWRGYLEAPEDGFFKVLIETDEDARVMLQLNEQPVSLTQDGGLWSNSQPLELQAGTLCPLALTVEQVHDVVRVQWEWEPKGQGRVVIPPRYLYPATLFDRFEETYVRFLKTASLATGLGLTANELAYVATHPTYQVSGDGWLNALPVTGDPAPGSSPELLESFEALLNFSQIKAELSPRDESLLTVLRDPATATADADSLLFTLTHWSKTSLTDVVDRLRVGSTLADLGDFDLFRRAYEAMAVVQKLGVPANALIQATTNEPTADTVRAVQSALRALYDDSAWRDVVRPINDEMRGLQRDALVAHILHRMRSHPDSEHIDTPEKLFEYFLMDVQMEPCMQTSRIRHALSSVQLFIERCLMNLEPRVSPRAIRAEQWEWMKRYRVWEANRKIFLWPENWLEPELRDDQSPFFKETMSELLQGDITEESAQVALLNYLAKLDEVAKLEPCGIHYVEPAEDGTGEVAHVVARTAGAHRKYYYRRFERGSWGPWERIQLDIEDNPVIPVVWNDRLLLFWLRILKSPIDEQIRNPGPTSARGEKTMAEATFTEAKENARRDAETNTKVKVQVILCWSEYYNGRWQPTKTSNVDAGPTLGDFSPNDFDRSWLRLGVVFVKPDPSSGETDVLRIMVSGLGRAVGFFLYDTHSLPLLEADVPHEFTAMFDVALPSRELHTLGSERFTVDYHTSRVFHSPSVTKELLRNNIEDRTIEPQSRPLENAWEAPFFYEDSRHVFYVTTTKGPHSTGYWRTSDYQRIAQEPPPLTTTRDFASTTNERLSQLGGARIKNLLASEDTVLYGDTPIGPGGRNPFRRP